VAHLTDSTRIFGKFASKITANYQRENSGITAPETAGTAKVSAHKNATACARLFLKQSSYVPVMFSFVGDYVLAKHI
jgi:hypothetical protein